jgi:predicted transcriptional regulator
MAQVVVNVNKNPDDTFTVTLNAKAEKVLKRIADERDSTKAKVLEQHIEGFLKNKDIKDKQDDGFTLAEKYDLCNETQQDAVDAILDNPLP